MNRQTLVLHSFWSARNRPTEADAQAFQRVALAAGKPVSQWMSDGNERTAIGAMSRIGDVLDLRAQLRKFHDELLAEAQRANDATRTGGGDPARANELVSALRALGKAVEAANSTIDTHAQLRGARQIGDGYSLGGDRAAPDGGVQVRSGADYERAFAHTADDDERRALDDGSLTLGAFMRGVARMRTSEAAQRALSIGTDAAGGYSVPTVLMPGLLDALVPASSLLSAGVPMTFVDGSTDGAKSFNFAAMSSIPTAAWRAENGAVSESDPVLRNVAAVPRSLSFYFKCSRELLADAQGLDVALNRAIAQAIAKEIDRAGLRGSGSAPEPRGILNTSGIVSVTNGTNGASLGTTAYANFISAVQALLAADAPTPTAAIMAPRSLTTLGGLLDTTNQPRMRPDILKDVRFLTSSQVPVALTVGTSGDCSEIYIADFAQTMTFVFRERLSVQAAVEAFATSGQVAFVVHARVDVAVLYPAAVALATGVRA